jgi:ribosomal protein S18 acetylase RimI-like enzyme
MPTSDEHPLDNAVWWALGSRHADIAQVHGRARRYDSDVSVFAAVDTFDPESWHDLATLLGAAGTCALFGGDIPNQVPSGWDVISRGRGRQMVLDFGQLADVESVVVRQLTTEDVPQMLDLVSLTKPGPFRTGTIEMGRYFGHFEGERLVSMAGERLGFDGHTEISAVCTHPDVRGRGLATGMTRHVAAAIFERGDQPFLHVAESNTGALRVYANLGFVERRFVDVAVLRAPKA